MFDIFHISPIKNAENNINFIDRKAKIKNFDLIFQYLKKELHEKFLEFVNSEEKDDFIDEINKIDIHLILEKYLDFEIQDKFIELITSKNRNEFIQEDILSNAELFEILTFSIYNGAFFTKEVEPEIAKELRRDIV